MLLCEKPTLNIAVWRARRLSHCRQALDPAIASYHPRRVKDMSPRSGRALILCTTCVFKEAKTVGETYSDFVVMGLGWIGLVGTSDGLGSRLCPNVNIMMGMDKDHE